MLFFVEVAFVSPSSSDNSRCLDSDSMDVIVRLIRDVTRVEEDLLPFADYSRLR